MAHSTHCCDFDVRVSQKALGFTLLKVKQHFPER